MGIKLVADIVGSLFPVIFPKQEFKPKRAIGAVVAFALAVVAVQFLGLEGAESAVSVAIDIIEMTEE